ncbi:hypothetical protein [Polynucleobacter sp. MWH-UH2A]|uniref:hypothetical protein n=1 Tax=Polynucleobacter sp. MWH-UH2A TaxID=1855617 RepID=UPI002040B7C1|nr:hypothetical protein [Polynucleobacter sp. MWH-UH2A]
MQSPEQRYTALFPGKPDKLERQIPFGDQEFHQALEAVKIDDDIYSISTIEIPAQQADSDSIKKITAQLQSNLLDRAKASGGSVATEVANFQNSQHQRIATTDYYIVFNQPSKAQQAMRVRWITRTGENKSVWVYQISVLHSNANTNDAKALLSKEEYANFFNEFVLE